MKRIYLLALAASLSFAGLSAQTTAQSAYGSPMGSIVTDRDLPDLIVLSDGMSAKCRIITYVPGHPVKVLLSDAKVHVYSPEEVTRVERGKPAVPPVRGAAESQTAAPVEAKTAAPVETKTEVHATPKTAAPAVAKPAAGESEILPDVAANQYAYDYVVLKSGRTLKCKVLESNDNGVQIEMPDGTIFYYRAVDVERVERRPSAKAIAAARDVIVLKNGQKVQGTVLERSLESPVKLRNVHGQVFTYKWDEVERILIDKNKKADASVENAKSRKLRLGFTAEVGMGYGLEQKHHLVGEMNPEFSLTVGTRLSRLVYVGVGATAQRYDRTEILPITPMLLARFDYPLQGKFIPFLDLRAGYTVNTMSDKKNYPEMAVYAGAQLGVRYRKWTFGVGGVYHQVNKSIKPNAGQKAPDGSYGKRVIPAAGWQNQPEFTLRLGYQF